MPVDLERPADAAHSDYATNVTMKLTGVRREAPREGGSEFADEVEAIDGIAGVVREGPRLQPDVERHVS